MGKLDSQWAEKHAVLITWWAGIRLMIVVIFTSSLRFPSHYMLRMFLCSLCDSKTEQVTGLVVVFLAMAAGEDNRSLSVRGSSGGGGGMTERGKFFSPHDLKFSLPPPEMKWQLDNLNVQRHWT